MPPPRNTAILDSTFSVCVPVISHGTPCLVSGRTLKAHSSGVQQYKPDSFQKQHPHYHVFFPSISPYFGHLDLPKTTMVCINIILESLQIKRMNKFFPYHLFNFSTAGTSCAPLDTGGGTAYPPCSWHGSRVVPPIPQGVAMVPANRILGLAK